MKSYVFKVVVEPDADKWYACVPELESKGAATWGTRAKRLFATFMRSRGWLSRT